MPVPEAGLPLLRVSGSYFRAVPPNRVDAVLSPPAPESAGRYHRPGEPALYMSPSAEWARIAVSGYMREDGTDRVIVRLEVDAANVIDQRDHAACSLLGIDPAQSDQPWRMPLSTGRTPPSWLNADRAREVAADGLIDRSRHISGGWHLVLFRWNAPGAPRISVVGPVGRVSPGYEGPKWG